MTPFICLYVVTPRHGSTVTDNLYVYGVTADEELELEVAGVGDAEEITTVSYQNLGAVVSPIDTTEPETTDEDAQAHDDVLRAVLEDEREPTVVPMQYGMAFSGTRTLKNLLRGARPAFRRALNDVEGSVELGVKVVTEEDGSIDRETARETVEDAFDGLYEERVENDLFSDRLLVNDAYLVDRDGRNAFDEAVGDLESDLDGQAMVQYTGPWAPYNFVDIDIGAQR